MSSALSRSAKRMATGKNSWTGTSAAGGAWRRCSSAARTRRCLRPTRSTTMRLSSPRRPGIRLPADRGRRRSATEQRGARRPDERGPTSPERGYCQDPRPAPHAGEALVEQRAALADHPGLPLEPGNYLFHLVSRRVTIGAASAVTVAARVVALIGLGGNGGRHEMFGWSWRDRSGCRWRRNCGRTLVTPIWWSQTV